MKTDLIKCKEIAEWRAKEWSISEDMAFDLIKGYHEKFGVYAIHLSGMPEFTPELIRAAIKNDEEIKPYPLIDENGNPIFY